MRIKSILNAGMIFLAALTGSAAAEPITLTVQHSGARGGIKATYETIAEKFMAANPDIKIKFLNSTNNYEEALQSAIRYSLVGQAPDVSFHGLNLVRALVSAKIATPLNQFIEKDGGQDKLGLPSSLMSAAKFGDKYYGMPFMISSPVLYLNLDLLKNVGVDQSNFPKTWPEIVALGEKLNDPSKNQIGFYFRWEVTGNWAFQSLLFSKGGKLLSEDEKTVAFDGPEGEWAFNTLESFAKAGMPNLTSSEARAAFAAGKIAIMFDSSSSFGSQKRNIDGKFKVALAPFPLPDKEKGRLPSGGAAGTITTNDPKKAAAAWKFLKFATGPESQPVIVHHTGYIPSNFDALNNPNMKEFFVNNPNYKIPTGQLPKMIGWYAFPGSKSVKIIDDIKRHMEKVVTGKGSGSEELKAAAEEVQALLN